ncbi:MAG: hypothetical protein GX346_03345 [Clostridiales bacterium]|nr:hypothetical protein [Clostridiales bacterium]
MKMKKFIALLLTFSLVLTACDSNKEVNLQSMSETKENDYKQSDSLSDKIVIEKFRIDIPENASVSSFCVYDDIIYYSINYISKYENSEGNKTELVFDKKDNTEIRSCSLDNSEDKLIYKYDEDTPINITDIQFNGTYLIWEDYDKYQMYTINSMDLKNSDTDKAPEKIFSQGKDDSKLKSITLTISEDELYWYDYSSKDDTVLSLYSYDFKDKNTNAKVEKLTLDSPYEHLSLNDGLFTTYQREDGFTLIKTFEDFKKAKTTLKVSENIRNPVANKKICAWMQGGENANKDYIFVYSFSKKDIEKIKVFEVFSYSVLDDLLIINQKDGIYCYDIENSQYNRIISESEDSSCGYIYSGIEDNLYFERWAEDNVLEVYNYKIA